MEGAGGSRRQLNGSAAAGTVLSTSIFNQFLIGISMKKVEYISPDIKTVIVEVSRIMSLSEEGFVKNEDYGEDNLVW